MDQLIDDDLAVLNLHINSFHINFRGILDNYTRAYFYQHEREKTKKKDGTEKHIDFKNETWGKVLNKELYHSLEKHMNWVEEMKDRRHEIAHGMPLHVPPTINPQEFGKPDDLDKDNSCTVFLDDVPIDNTTRIRHMFGYIAKDGNRKYLTTEDILATDLENLLKIHKLILDAICS